jgi:hypothetical protein
MKDLTCQEENKCQVLSLIKHVPCTHTCAANWQGSQCPKKNFVLHAHGKTASLCRICVFSGKSKTCTTVRSCAYVAWRKMGWCSYFAWPRKNTWHQHTLVLSKINKYVWSPIKASRSQGIKESRYEGIKVSVKVFWWAAGSNSIYDVILMWDHDFSCLQMIGCSACVCSFRWHCLRSLSHACVEKFGSRLTNKYWNALKGILSCILWLKCSYQVSSFQVYSRTP